MKSPLKKSIGEVVTDYGARVMKVFKKGLLQRSLFDFYGDVKADKLRVKESASVPATPVDGDGGVMYTKSADGKLYYKSNEVAEVELSAADTVLTSEQVQDIVGAMVDGGTETNIAVTYDDTGGKLNFVSTDTNTTYSEATSSAEGLMSTAHHDKLDGIEASADVTDATNVTAAGALMDSELTDLAGVKGVTISTLQVKPSEGAFVDGDKTKLDAIEASADVTDATNVTAAGALMDSELTDLSGVKSLDTSTLVTLAGTQTISGDKTFSGTLACVDLDITGSSNALTVNSTTGNVAINASSTDADCMVRVQDNSTAGTNAIGMVATGDDLVMRNDEGNFKVKVSNNATDALILDQSGNLSISGELTAPKRKFARTESATHFDVQGDVLYFGSGSTTQGDLCYLKEDGSWGQADADGAATGDDADRDAMGMLAIALGTDPDVDGMLIKGIITMDYDLGDVGNPIYVKVTAGGMSHVAPSASGDFVRVVGYCLDDDHGIIYFNPDNTWVEIA